jgi:hypothetical protein
MEGLWKGKNPSLLICAKVKKMKRKNKHKKFLKNIINISKLFLIIFIDISFTFTHTFEARFPLTIASTHVKLIHTFPISSLIQKDAKKRRRSIGVGDGRRKKRQKREKGKKKVKKVHPLIWIWTHSIASTPTAQVDWPPLKLTTAAVGVKGAIMNQVVGRSAGFWIDVEDGMKRAEAQKMAMALGRKKVICSSFH